MPPWSVEEWRVRIACSYSALGVWRPIKLRGYGGRIKSRRFVSSYPDRRYLSSFVETCWQKLSSAAFMFLLFLMVDLSDMISLSYLGRWGGKVVGSLKTNRLTVPLLKCVLLALSYFKGSLLHIGAIMSTTDYEMDLNIPEEQSIDTESILNVNMITRSHLKFLCWQNLFSSVVIVVLVAMIDLRNILAFPCWGEWQTRVVVPRMTHLLIEVSLKCVMVTLSYLKLLLVLSGDVETNPGPTSHAGSATTVSLRSTSAGVYKIQNNDSNCLVSMAFLMVVMATLLLESGNVERNPGPNTIIGDKDWADICLYLKKLDSMQIKRLGGVLGLNVFNLQHMYTLPDDMVTAWLRREDDVIKRSGEQLSWNVLARALQDIAQQGIADEIFKDKCMYETESDSALQVDLPPPTQEQTDSQALLEEALQLGHVQCNITILLFIGVAGAGKSSFMRFVLGQPQPDERNSTSLAERAVRAMSVSRAQVGSDKTTCDWNVVPPEEWLKLIAGDIKVGKTTPDPASNLPLPTEPSIVSKHFKTSSPHSVSAEPSPWSVDMAANSHLSKLIEDLLSHIHKSGGSKRLYDTDIVYLIDSGGQPQFHELLPTFLDQVSGAVFFVKLNETLDHYPEIKYYKDGQPCESFTSSLSHLQIIQNCLQKMQSRDSKNRCPQLFFVGTHSDKESDCKEESTSDKNGKLLKMFEFRDSGELKEKLSYYKYQIQPDIIEPIFPVSSTRQSGDDKHVALCFKKGVDEFCEKRSKPIPIVWYLLEQLLQSLSRTKGSDILSFGECLAVANGLFGMDESRLKAALQHFTNLNIFKYYPEVLPDVVFTSAQVVLDKVSELVEYKFRRHHLPAAKATALFLTNGIVNAKFLTKIDNEFKELFLTGLFEANDLLKLFKHLFVVVKLSESDNYVMACVLPELPEDELDSQRISLDSKSIAPLLIHYGDKLFPTEIFSALISYLESKCSWKVILSHGLPSMLKKNCAKFRPRKVDAVVTLIHSWTFKFIEIHTDIQSPSNEKQSSCSKICSDVLRGLEKVAKDQKYTCLKPELAFFCMCQHNESTSVPGLHLASRQPGCQSLVCSINEEKSTELSKEQLLWVNESNDVNQPDEPPTPSPNAVSPPKQPPTVTPELKPIAVVPGNDAGLPLPEPAPQRPPSEKDNEKPEFTEADCKEIAQNPKFPRNSVDDTTSKSLESMVKIIIHTCNEHEYQAVLERLSPPSPKGSGKLQYCPELNYGTITAVVGKLAIHTVAVLFTQQSLEALIPLESALKSFPSVQAIVAIGIGYGKDRTSIKFADVMVSEKIEDCSQVKNDEGTVKQRGPRTEVDNTLLQHFRMRKMEWDGTFQVSKSRKSLTKFGIVVSAPILMKNKLLKREYMSLVDETVGGEMEGFVLLNLVKRMKSENRQLSIIVIKGVADYGDSKKGDDWQFTAAKAAVDFVYYCFQKSNKNSIFCLGYTVKREYQSWCTWRYFFFFIIIPIFLGILLVYLTQF